MSLLDSAEGRIIDRAALAVLEMVKNHPGQAHELAARLEQFHLGHLLQSWVGPGVNLNITVDQIQGVLAEEHIAAVAQKLGMSQQEAASKIAELLPMVLSGALPRKT